MVSTTHDRPVVDHEKRLAVRFDLEEMVRVMTAREDGEQQSSVRCRRHSYITVYPLNTASRWTGSYSVLLHPSHGTPRIQTVPALKKCRRPPAGKREVRALAGCYFTPVAVPF